MTRSSELSIRSRRVGPYKIQSKIGRMLHAHHSSMLGKPVPSELRSFVAQLLAIEARKHHSAAFCAMCSEPIGESYLRETKTRLLYCDHKCYAGRCNGDATAYQHRARTS